MRDLDFGPQWLRQNGKVLSPEGERVARFCEWLFDGIYHQQDAVLAAKWDSFYVKLNLGLSASLSTWDFNTLTRLVVGAHDFCIRVEIEPCNFRFLRCFFHPRRTREGSAMARHPFMEQHLALMNRVEPWMPDEASS